MTNLLEIKGLSFQYGAHEVLKNLELEVLENELVCVLGVNGAGKSTLLKCINKILPSTSMKLELDSKSLSDLNQVELSKLVSYVPQSVRSGFSIDVFDVVMLGRKPYINWMISKNDREIVSNTLRYFGLEEFAFRKFNMLSGGERQRVIIAKAIAQQPRLFLLDEPTSDLDLNNQIQVMKKIKSLVSDKENPRSALLAIHDINIASRFADRIVLLSNGEIVANGAPLDVLTPKNIAEVFRVSSEVYVPPWGPIQIIIKDEITQEQERE